MNGLHIRVLNVHINGHGVCTLKMAGSIAASGYSKNKIDTNGEVE